MKELLLKENIEHLGRRGEVVKVANGYARNYLLPRQLALPVTKSNQRQVEFAQAAASKVEAAERDVASVLASRIGAVNCVIARRVGETNTLYGSVTSADLAEFLATRKIEVDKRKIQLGDPIRELGESVVPIRLHRDVTAQLTVRVIRDAVDPEESDGEQPAQAVSTDGVGS